MSNRFLKKPHHLSQKLGKLPVEIDFKYPKDLPNTCAAMEKIARAEARDDESKRKGENNYSISLKQLMDAFDIFIREYSKGKRKTGSRENYDLSIPCDLTIALIWNIRHVLTHNGGVIDKKCKEAHKKILEDANGTLPLIDLPTDLELECEPESEFIIDFDSYFSIKKCVFQYIENRIPTEDHKILTARASITDFKIKKCEITMPLGKGHISFDLDEAYEHGFSVDENKIVNSPENSKYDFEKELIILPDGRSFPAKYSIQFYPYIYPEHSIPNTRIDLTKIFAKCHR